MGKFIDLTNQHFGEWIVLERKGSKNNQIYWLCKCSCGTVKEVNGNSLRNGSSTNCGCIRKQKMASKCDNLVGLRFNSLTVLERVDSKWKCQCDCGAVTYVNTNDLKSNNIKSCKQCGYKNGANKRTIDLTGQQFGLLTVLEQAESNNGHTFWKCKCNCGNEKIITGSSLKQGLTKSCGCLKSIGEKTIIEILTQNNILYEYQKTFEDCRFTDTNALAIFDFYVNNQYIIEFDGQQHFYYSDTGWNTKEHFQKLQQRDLFKNEWCKNKNIPIIRIPYTHKDICLEDLLLETSKFILKN